MAALERVSEAYAATCDIAPRVHRRIVPKMREEYAGKRIRRKHEYSLVMWTPASRRISTHQLKSSRNSVS